MRKLLHVAKATAFVSKKIHLSFHFFQAVKKRERENTQKVKENNGVFFIFRVAFVLLCVIKMPALLRQQRGIRESRM